MFGRILMVVLLAAVGGLGGCHTYNAQEVNAFLLQPRRPVAAVEYRVMPPDVVQITSRQVPEINNQQQRLRPDGKINLPLLGEVYVAGMTPKEMERAICEAAGAYYKRDVDCTVAVLGYNSQKYYVFGQVTRPGPVPFSGRDTLLDALASAQPTSLAWPERIIVVRGDNPQDGGRYSETKGSRHYQSKGVHKADPDNPRHKMTINLMAMVREGDMSNNIMLLPNDVIYVQPNPLAAIGLAVQDLLFPIRPAIEVTGAPRTAAGAMGAGI